MKKIMFIMTALGGPGWGGAHKVSVMLANHLVQNGYDVSFAISEPSPVDYPIDPSIKVFYLCDYYKKSKNRTFNLLKKLKAFRKLCKTENIDLVVGFTSNMAIYTVLSTIFSKRKSLISERTDPHKEPRRKILRGLRNLLFRFADGIVFQTPGARDYYPKSVRKKSTIIPNPISASLPYPHKGERDLRIVNYCRIAPQKNLKVLLEAFDIFSKTHPEHTLEIYGDAKKDDSYAASVMEFAASLESGDKIHINKGCPDVHTKVLSATAFASSSDYEGLSNSMLEAMAIGLPTIVTDCENGGERMCIEDGENGLIVPMRNPQALAEALSKVADNPDFAKKLSENSVKIRDKFSTETVFKMWCDYISGILSERN